MILLLLEKLKRKHRSCFKFNFLIFKGRFTIKIFLYYSVIGYLIH